MLHGQGAGAEHVLPYFAGLAERQSMVVLYPNAQLPPAGAAAPDVLSRLFGERFRKPSWRPHRDDFPLTALRWALAHLDVDPDRTVLAGVSMGAFAAWNLGMRFGQHFSAVVPMAGGLSAWETMGQDTRTRYLLPNALAVPLFVVHGAQDTQVSPEFARGAVGELQRLGHPHLRYLEVPDGTHALRSLRMTEGGESLARLECWLDGRHRAADRPVVHHRALDDGHGRAHWAELAQVDEHTGAWLRAERLAPDAYRLETGGAGRVRLYLSGPALRPGQPVRAEVNGRVSVVHFQPDLRTVVELYRRDADPSLLAEQIVEFAVPNADRSDDPTHDVNERDYADAA
ncbi:hypothetical protein LN042_35665 [Kitasatospora sp. RB6PN24]|nr:hypothetical protein [Kitasatospora humi]